MYNDGKKQSLSYSQLLASSDRYILHVEISKVQRFTFVIFFQECNFCISVCVQQYPQCKQCYTGNIVCIHINSMKQGGNSTTLSQVLTLQLRVDGWLMGKWVQPLMFDCRLEKALGKCPLSFISCFQFLQQLLQ